MNDPLALSLSILLLVAAIVAAILAWPAWSAARRGIGQETFRERRRVLMSHRTQLSRAAGRFYAGSGTLPGLPLIFPPGWLPPEPMPLASVQIRIVESSPAIAGPAAGSLLPRRDDGHRFESYSSATEKLDKPKLFTNGLSYRLLGVKAMPNGFVLSVGRGHYFEMLDTCEVLGFEVAASGQRPWEDGSHPKPGPVRRQLGAPADLSRRCVIPGVNTLTIRDDGTKAGFFMHQRDRASVATAMDTFHVAPAGEFQPAGVDPTIFVEDADLWRNIVREYAEEFLHEKDAMGLGGRVIDWSKDEPFASIHKAGLAGSIGRYFLGVGIDPLTLKAEILTACVFPSALFDRIFGPAISRLRGYRNAEGVLLVGNGNRGRPFDAAHLAEFVGQDASSTLPAGAACLELAWRWRETLLGAQEAQHAAPEPQ